MNENNKKAKNIKIIDKKITNTGQDCEQIMSDVLGSYTGTPDEFEQPVQDVDDL